MRRFAKSYSNLYICCRNFGGRKFKTKYRGLRIYHFHEDTISVQVKSKDYPGLVWPRENNSYIGDATLSAYVFQKVFIYALFFNDEKDSVWTGKSIVGLGLSVDPLFVAVIPSRFLSSSLEYWWDLMTVPEKRQQSLWVLTDHWVDPRLLLQVMQLNLRCRGLYSEPADTAGEHADGKSLSVGVLKT